MKAIQFNSKNIYVAKASIRQTDSYEACYLPNMQVHIMKNIYGIQMWWIGIYYLYNLVNDFLNVSQFFPAWIAFMLRIYN